MTAVLARGDDKATFGELNRRHRLRIPWLFGFEGFDATGAILSAQAMTPMRGQLNGRRLKPPPLARPNCGRPGEYTLKNIVETMPYDMNSERAPHQSPPRTPVQHFEVSEDEAGVRLDNALQKRLCGVPRSRIFRIIRKGEVRVNGKRASPQLRLKLNDKV